MGLGFGVFCSCSFTPLVLPGSNDVTLFEASERALEARVKSTEGLCRWLLKNGWGQSWGPSKDHSWRRGRKAVDSAEEKEVEILAGDPVR